MKHILTEEEKENQKKKKEEKLKKQESVKQTNDRIFDLLFVQDELSWKDLIFKLIEEEHMDPWDIDVSILSQKFLEMLSKLRELDFRISGKMILASAVLLKMKSDILIDQDIAHFDNVMNATEEDMPLEDAQIVLADSTGQVQIFPRTPQPRKRKVSVFDLVKALEKALEVESRRRPIGKKIEMKIPDRRFDLGKAMHVVYDKVEKHYNNKKTKDTTLTFEQLVMSGTKNDKVLTFVPLLHLDTQRKIDLEQEDHFTSIAVRLTKPFDYSQNNIPDKNLGNQE
jgi:segregation and condensation protein A